MPPVNYRKFGGFHRGIGDESNSPVLELLLPGELTETYSRALHIAQADDVNTDWNVAAAADPTLFLHSTTTPATDYVRMDHDGTTADLDVVGGTTLSIQIDGAAATTIAATGITLPANRDLLFTGTTGTNDIVLTDALADALSITDGSADILVIDTNTTGNVATLTARLGVSADVRITTGNFRAGTVSAFGTTEPTSAVVLKEGTAPSGAIATSGGIFSSSTVVRKIIADGTISNVET